MAECCRAAPPILEFDPEGNLVNSWGGPGEGYDWPQSNHGITLDGKDNVWIGGNGRTDSHILKFTHDGKFLMTVGEPKQGVNSASTTSFGRVAKIAFDDKANEAYIADGYGNKRVAVIDMTTGRSSASGCLRQRAERHEHTYNPMLLPPRSSATRCTAPSRHMMGWSMCATGPMTVSRSFAPTAGS
jgi:hypothetical protein